MKESNYYTRSISSFLDDEYKKYSFYVAQNRACPSLIDGFKTGARKIIHASMKGSLKNGDTKKVTALCGETMTYSLFQHGDSSLSGTIITISQDFNFNLNPLYIDGQSGTLRSPEAASPRYLYVRHSKYTPIWKEDYDLLDFEEEEGQLVEPKYYLPIIPVILCQRQQGMAPGYAFSTMSYNPLDIIDQCKLYINKKNTQVVLHPCIKDIKKKNWVIEKDKDGNDIWVNYGAFKYDSKKQEVIITDLPYDTTFDSFEKLLNKMVENEDIKDWKNLSSGNDIEYHIDCKKGKWGTLLKKTKKGTLLDDRVHNKLKLRKVVPNDLLWVVDENKKIRHFNTAYELIEYFTTFRLAKYTDRKKLLIKKLSDQIEKNDELVRFIELVCKGKLKIRNRAKADIKVDMTGFKLPMELITTPMSKCTIEERDELLKQNKELHDRLEYIKKTSEKDMYINDLDNLRTQLEKDFK